MNALHAQSQAEASHLAPHESDPTHLDSARLAPRLPALPKVALIAGLFLGMGISLAEIFTIFG